ncbi:unnamed protein product [Gadus morhua 'NCC']
MEKRSENQEETATPLLAMRTLDHKREKHRPTTLPGWSPKPPQRGPELKPRNFRRPNQSHCVQLADLLFFPLCRARALSIHPRRCDAAALEISGAYMMSQAGFDADSAVPRPWLSGPDGPAPGAQGHCSLRWQPQHLAVRKALLSVSCATNSDRPQLHHKHNQRAFTALR